MVNCDKCGDTGSVRCYGAEDYGVSFECEYCESCPLGLSLIAADAEAWNDDES